MNNYPEWWCTTITLFNRYVDDTGRVFWFSHTLSGCFYDHTKDRIAINNTIIESDVSICRIRVSEDFVGKREWNALSAEQKAQKFTLATGDIVVNGDISFAVDEYANGSRSSDLIKTFSEWPGCFTVETASINVGSGRGNEHYLARGK